MTKFAVDAYFTENESKAVYMMGSSDPESLLLGETGVDLSSFACDPIGYALGNGYRPLLEKLSGFYREVSPEGIAMMNGGEEAIYVTMRALLKPGDQIVVHMPSYQSLWTVATEIGCSVLPFRPRFESGWSFDVDELAAAITLQTKFLVLNYPHNPTGACLTKAQMNSIVELCSERDICLIADEAYRFLRLDEQCSDASFADLHENSVALGSFSKTFAAPGLRLGWVATRNSRLMKKILAYRHFTSTCPNLPCQWIATALLNRGQSIIDRNNAIVRENAALLAWFVQKHAELFDYVAPQGATMAYVKLLKGCSSTAFCKEILADTGVLIVPSSVLEESEQFIRVGLCRDDFSEGIRILDEYLTNRNK